MAPVFPLVLAQKPNGSVLGGGGGMSIISLRLRTMEEGADRAGRWETGSRPHNLSLETLAQRQGCKHQHIECQTTTK